MDAAELDWPKREGVGGFAAAVPKLKAPPLAAVQVTWLSANALGREHVRKLASLKVCVEFLLNI